MIDNLIQPRTDYQMSRILSMKKFSNTNILYSWHKHNIKPCINFGMGWCRWLTIATKDFQANEEDVEGILELSWDNKNSMARRIC